MFSKPISVSTVCSSAAALFVATTMKAHEGREISHEQQRGDVTDISALSDIDRKHADAGHISL